MAEPSRIVCSNSKGLSLAFTGRAQFVEGSDVMNRRKLVSRRAVLAGSAAAGALFISSRCVKSAEPQWKKFAGTTLEVNLIKGPRADLLQRHEAEFTARTGIKVGSEVIPEQQQRQKVVIELTSGRPSFDVVHLSYHVQKRLFDRAKWLADLSGFLKDPSLTVSDLTESDFSAAGLQFAKDEKGELHSLPWSVDYFILYWNKEIFQGKGVALPQNLDEMARTAEALTDTKAGIYGFVGRGLRNANMTLWSNFFLNFGGEFLDAKGNILTDGPEAVEATKFYQRLLTKTAPPGVHAGPLLSYSALSSVSVAWASRHPLAANHYPSRSDSADRDLDNDCPF
jgi:multiple sugar transport system substrate-binding protein